MPALVTQVFSRLRGRLDRVWTIISRWFLAAMFILVVGFVIWGTVAWFPAPMKPLAGTVLGWVLGLLSVPIVETVKGTRDAQQLSQLLKIEVQHNLHAVVDYRNGLERFAKLSGLPLDHKGTPAVEPPPPGLFRTTVFNATLSKHGLLPAYIVQHLHDFYWHLAQVETFREAWKDKRSDPREVHYLIRVGFEEAATAAKIGHESRLIYALDREGKRGVFQRVFRAYM